MTWWEMSGVFVLLAALLIDGVVGDPPNAVHPVAWMGKLIGFLARWCGRCPPAVQFLYGVFVVLATLAVCVVPVVFVLIFLRDVSLLAYVIFGALAFKLSFSLKGLRQAAVKVRDLLATDKAAQARFELRALVGRNTADLDEAGMVSATVESVAENSCDSFFSPLFYFLFFGVPGAVAYRVINTLDNMIGHRGRYEYIGKFAARLDDVANFVPARLTALTIVLASWIRKKNAAGAWRIMLRDRGNTASPNSGWTMSAMAGALGVQLEKVGHYRLGDHDPSGEGLTLSLIGSSLKVMMTAAVVWTLIVVAAEVIYHAAT